jgi:hypothetical protein
MEEIYGYPIFFRRTACNFKNNILLNASIYRILYTETIFEYEKVKYDQK